MILAPFGVVLQQTVVQAADMFVHGKVVGNYPKL